MSTISSCEIFTSPGGSLRLDEEDGERVMGISGIAGVCRLEDFSWSNAGNNLKKVPVKLVRCCEPEGGDGGI